MPPSALVPVKASWRYEGWISALSLAPDNRAFVGLDGDLVAVNTSTSDGPTVSNQYFVEAATAASSDGVLAYAELVDLGTFRLLVSSGGGRHCPGEEALTSP